MASCTTEGKSEAGGRKRSSAASTRRTSAAMYCSRSFVAVLLNTKPLTAAQRRPLDVDGADGGCGRTLPDPFDERIHGPRRPFYLYLHAPVRQVARKADQTMLVGQAACEVPKADALHAS